MNKPRIIVAMPAFNEENYIGMMVIKCKQYADEIIVVDDGSVDETARLAKEAGAEVISHNRNLGYGATIQSIILEARKREFDAFVIIDADNQHNPDDIPNLVKPISEGHDLAIGSRSNKDIPIYRQVGGKILSILTSRVAGENVKDTQCGFRAFSPKAIRVLHLRENGMAVSSEITIEAGRSGLKIKEVPISVRYTKDSSTYNPIYQGFYTLWRIMVMMVKGEKSGRDSKR